MDATLRSFPAQQPGFCAAVLFRPIVSFVGVTRYNNVIHGRMSFALVRGLWKNRQEIDG